MATWLGDQGAKQSPIVHMAQDRQQRTNEAEELGHAGAARRLLLQPDRLRELALGLLADGAMREGGGQ